MLLKGNVVKIESWMLKAIEDQMSYYMAHTGKPYDRSIDIQLTGTIFADVSGGVERPLIYKKIFNR